MTRRLFLMMPIVALASGCAAHGYCSRPGAYEKAESVTPTVAVEGLNFKQSPNAYLIPAPPPDPQPFGTLARDPKSGRKEWQCLDQPPAFAPGTVTRVTEATTTPPIK